MTDHCPESPRELNLDFDAWWPGQRETINVIVEHFVAGKKYVLAAIPTGGGKTIIASAVQKILAQGSGASGGSSLALTHTIQLQQQYKATLSDAVVVTGRGNHPCELSASHPARMIETPDSPLTAETAPCGQGEKCDELKDVAGGCSYYAQFHTAAKAPMAIMNYAYAARILPIPKFKGYEDNPFRRQLLVADECHLAERAIIEAAGFKLWKSALDKVGLDYPPLYTRQRIEEGGPRSQRMVEYETPGVWIAWAGEHLQRVRDAARIAKQTVKSLQTTGGQRREVAKANGEATRLKVLADGMQQLASIRDPNEWIIRRDVGARGDFVISATVQPLWGWSAAPHILFAHFQRVLLMSATPGDPEVARVTLGIPKEEFVYVERPSTFPVANRPVYYLPIVKLNYKSSDSDWEKLADVIFSLASQSPYDARKGLIHSGSKANARRIVELLNARFGQPRAFTHGDDGARRGGVPALTREAALDQFVSVREPLILVTASFTTGLDLPYLIGWQVIAKVPYGNLGDVITARRRAFKLANGYTFGQQCYESECLNTVVQAAGRIVRSPSDSGPTFILDGNYAMLHSRAYKPQFYVDAFRRVERSQ